MILQFRIVAIRSARTGCNATIRASHDATAARPSGESRSDTLIASIPPASAKTASSIAASSRLACASTTVAIPTPLDKDVPIDQFPGVETPGSQDEASTRLCRDTYLIYSISPGHHTWPWKGFVRSARQFQCRDK